MRWDGRTLRGAIRVNPTIDQPTHKGRTSVCVGGVGRPDMVSVVNAIYLVALVVKWSADRVVSEPTNTPIHIGELSGRMW